MNRSLIRLTMAALLTQLMLAQPEPARTPGHRSTSEIGKHLIDGMDNDSSAEATVRELEEHVEAAIVTGDTAFLQSVYADDFRFTHFTGQIQNKTQWLGNVARRPFVSRKLDVLDVEIHGNVAVTYGQVDMTQRNEHGEHSSLLKYVRVYEHRSGHWQMLTHRSVAETAEPHK